MKPRLRRLLHNPFIIVVPLVLLLLLSWQRYTYGGRNLSLATDVNVMPNTSFMEFGQEGVPKGWRLDNHAGATLKAEPTKGYVGGKGVKVTVKDYQKGDVILASPRVSVQTQTAYLFKGYYSTDVSFDLLVHEYYRDGTERLFRVKDYPAQAGIWSTAGHGFNTGNTVSAVQFLYRVAGNGSLEINGPYLEPRVDVYVEPAVPTTPNIIPNPLFAVGDTAMPDDWSPYQAGSNKAEFAYRYEENMPYLQANVAQYRDGEVKWQFHPIDTRGGQYYNVRLQYRGDAPSIVVAEFTIPGKKSQFVALAGLPPSAGWTTISENIDTPPGATSMFISVVLKGNGKLDTKDYSVVDITKANGSQWKRPLVSVTFDDGWEAAYSNAVPILDGHTYKATFYMNPASVETPHFMHVTELQALRERGYEIAAHGYSHEDMTSINAERLAYQLREGRDYLTRAGYPTEHFAPPYGKADAQVQWYARQYYKTLRTTETGINTLQNFDPYNLRVLYVEEATSPNVIKEALRKAKEQNGWLIFVYHRVGNSDISIKSLQVEDPAVSAATFKRHIQLIHDSGIAVETVANAYNELKVE